jgi:hypothetical protein
VKSCARDFLTDLKWPDYRAFFAVDADVPRELVPTEAGLIVAAGSEAALLREAPGYPRISVRCRARLHRFALLVGAAGSAGGSGQSNRHSGSATGQIKKCWSTLI